MQTDVVLRRSGLKSGKTIRRNVLLTDTCFETKIGRSAYNQLQNGRVTSQAYEEIQSELDDLNRPPDKNELIQEQAECRKAERRRKLKTDLQTEQSEEEYGIEEARATHPHL